MRLDATGLRLFFKRAGAFIKLVRGEDKSLAAAGFYAKMAAARLAGMTFWPRRTALEEAMEAWRFVCRRYPKET